MNIRRYVICGIISVLVCANLSFANTIEYAASDGTPLISVNFPDGWKLESKGDKLYAISPDGTFFLGLMSVEGTENWETAMEALAESLDEELKDIQWGEDSEVEINNLDIMVLSGAGIQKEDDVVISFGFYLFSPDHEKHFCSIMGYAEPEAWDEYDEDIRSILTSIKSAAETGDDEDEYQEESLTSQTAIEDEGDFILVFEEGEDELSENIRKTLLEEGRFEGLMDTLNELALPTDITVRFRKGDPGEAYYDPNTREIVLSYDFAYLISAMLTQSPYEEYQESSELVMEATLDTLEYVLFHEAGHALVDVLEIPVTGREEDAVDALSAVILSFILEEPAILISAADFYDVMSLHKDEITDEDLWDEHALDDQRYYNLVCWCYGSNPVEFEDFLEDSGMGEDRAVRCEEEYEQIVQSWLTLLDPYIKE